MEIELVNILRCPRCEGKLTIQEVKKIVDDNILTGSAKCIKCSTIFDIKDGILDILCSIDSVIASEIEHWDAFANGFKRHPACENLRDKLSLVVSDLLAKILDRHLQKKSSIVLFEIGCGTSETIYMLPPLAKEVTYIGIDVSIAMLSKASHKKKNCWKINLIRGDANKPLLREKAVDLVLSFGALHHLNLEESLNGISTSLREGGILLLFEPNKLNFFAKIGRQFIKNFFTEGEKPLSPFQLRTQALSYNLKLREEIGLFPVAQLYAYLVGLLDGSNSNMVSLIRTLDPVVFFVDSLLQRTSLSYPLSTSFLQVYKKGSAK